MYGEVVETIQLTPTLVRIVLGGEGLADFEPTEHTDEYVNALFIPDGSPLTVPFDSDETKAVAPELRPRGRRYTIRSWDGDTRRVAIDFVTHGDEGYAGRWAANASAGDRLQIVGPSGGYSPDPSAEWYLMVGDESALPAIARSLEVVRPGARVEAVLVVDGPECELQLESPGEVACHWVHRGYTEADLDQVVGAVAAIDFPSTRPDVFVHGEAEEIRSVRRLLAEGGVEVAGASISPYWRRGMTDEAWREEKRAWVQAMHADA